jgi:protein-L-isoaspartate(D-aspartate) O-methyltransferase
MSGKVLTLLIVLLAFVPSLAKTADEYQRERDSLVKEIEETARYAAGNISLDRRVLTVMAKVPRHEFVSPAYKSLAYANNPLPIGKGQTISQPFIVALMTDLMDIDKDDVVLEVGTGSGYQAAVLSELVKKVWTIEIIRELADTARQRLARLGYRNVEVRTGDGYYGWEERGPFDAIIVTAAAGHVPPPLIRQLKPGGKIVIPVGGVYQVQTLIVVTKEKSGKLNTRQLIPVSFVPMTGGAR